MQEVIAQGEGEAQYDLLPYDNSNYYSNPCITC